MVYRLTEAGEAERRRWFGERDPRELGAVRAPAVTRCDPYPIEKLLAAYPPAVSEGVRCRCTHCGTVFEDATPGGSCGRCGLAVEAAGLT